MGNDSKYGENGHDISYQNSFENYNQRFLPDSNYNLLRKKNILSQFKQEKKIKHIEKRILAKKQSEELIMLNYFNNRNSNLAL